LSSPAIIFQYAFAGYRLNGPRSPFRQVLQLQDNKTTNDTTLLITSGQRKTVPEVIFIIQQE
jgi:hypothetical protein